FLGHAVLARGALQVPGVAPPEFHALADARLGDEAPAVGLPGTLARLLGRLDGGEDRLLALRAREEEVELALDEVVLRHHPRDEGAHLGPVRVGRFLRERGAGSEEQQERRQELHCSCSSRIMRRNWTTPSAATFGFRP